MGLTATGIVPDSHRIPFSPIAMLRSLSAPLQCKDRNYFDKLYRFRWFFLEGRQKPRAERRDGCCNRRLLALADNGWKFIFKEIHQLKTMICDSKQQPEVDNSAEAQQAERGTLSNKTINQPFHNRLDRRQKPRAEQAERNILKGVRQQPKVG